MSQENLDLVVRAMEAVLRRPKPDFETVNALYHPDHVLVPLAAHSFGAVSYTHLTLPTTPYV